MESEDLLVWLYVYLLNVELGTSSNGGIALLSLFKVVRCGEPSSKYMLTSYIIIEIVLHKGKSVYFNYTGESSNIIQCFTTLFSLLILALQILTRTLYAYYE